MTQPLLSIKNLKLSFPQEHAVQTVVNDISFQIHSGKLTALVGESGSGKSLTALSVLQLLPKNTIQQGSIQFSVDGITVMDILNASDHSLQKIRGNQIGMIFQEPMSALNPVMRCGKQVVEQLITHLKLNKKIAREKCIQLFEAVELPNPISIMNRYPHQLSGGQQQRVMIAMAMSCNPRLLIADEPTTALDVNVQSGILQLIKKIKEDQQLGVLFITHDLAVVREIADEIVVMYKGCIVEQGPAAQVLDNPAHPYTQALLACRPNKKNKGNRLPVISDFLNPATENESNFTQPKQTHIKPEIKSINPEPLIRVQDLSVSFPVKHNFWGLAVKRKSVVDHVSFDIMQGEMVGLVGSSGSGKTTLGKAILQLIKPTQGNILLNGNPITGNSLMQRKDRAKEIQIVFQDPFGSLNPRISIGDALLEVLLANRIITDKQIAKNNVLQMLENVSLNPEHFTRYPQQFSGGQRQRICLARALMMNPGFLVFDESVSALDVSVQATILNLIQELKRTMGFTGLFISHDLNVVYHICDTILVMQDGKIVERGSAENIFMHPQHPFTQELIQKMPSIYTV